MASPDYKTLHLPRPEAYQQTETARELTKSLQLIVAPYNK